MKLTINQLSVIGMVLSGTFFILMWAFKSTWNLDYLIYFILFYIIYNIKSKKGRNNENSSS